MKLTNPSLLFNNMTSIVGCQFRCKDNHFFNLKYNQIKEITNKIAIAHLLVVQKHDCVTVTAFFSLCRSVLRFTVDSSFTAVFLAVVA